MAFLEIEKTGIRGERVLERHRRALQNMTSEEMEAFVNDIHSTVHSITPVWTGRAVANFTWSQGAPATGSKEPVEVGEPGEARRGPNQAISDATLNGLNFESPEEIYLVNNAQYPDGNTFMDLEYGRLPTPERSRVPPRGIIRLAFQRALNNHYKRRSRHRVSGV